MHTACRPASSHGTWLVPPAPTPCDPQGRPLNKPQNRPKWRLIAFPYAGGSATVYRNWPARLGESIDLLALQLPGRGARFAEAPISDFSHLVRAVADALQARPQTLPTAFFGHSLGALLAFEVACELAARGAPQPQMLLLSGRAAPAAGLPTVLRECRTDADFIAELQRLQGTPREVLDAPDLLALLMPTIRADFALLHSWRARPGAVWDGPIVALAGRRDPHVPLAAVDAWAGHAGGRFERLNYAGGHFFLHEQEREVVRDVALRLHDLGVVA